VSFGFRSKRKRHKDGVYYTPPRIETKKKWGRHVLHAAPDRNEKEMGAACTTRRPRSKRKRNGGSVWDSRAPGWKESPQNKGGDKRCSNGAACGMHTARSHLEGQTRWCVGCTPPRWSLERRCRRDGAQMCSLPTRGSLFLLLLLLPLPPFHFLIPSTSSSLPQPS